ncbi:MAG TPA: hypothetical protein VJ724_03655, partial [Tahibacter sp.]|nr:hypothetical protein [Tahibacter sp.]
HDAKALELPENRIFIEAHEFALNGGITIPLHRGVKWALLSLSFASFAESVEANRRLVELFFIAHNVHETALRVMTTPPPNPDGIELTAIEYECLRLAADGLPTPEMSVRLGRPVRAVTLVFESLFKKLGVRTRAAAVAYALRKGLIDA